jgi:hypothetical protein
MNRRRLAIIIASAAIGAAACADIVGIIDVPDGAVITDSGAGDVDAGPQLCDPTTPFGPPTLVQGLPTDGVADFQLSADELTVFVLHGAPYLDAPGTMKYATRGDASAAFGSETVIPTDTRVFGVTMASDNLTYVWEHADPYDGSIYTPQHFFLSTRSSPSQPFNLLDGGKALTGLNGVTEVGPALTSDGTQLYYAELTSGVVSIRHSAADGGFATSNLVPGLPTGTYRAVFTSDGLVAYLTNDGSHIKVATRTTTADSFGSASVVIAFDSGASQFSPIFITDNRCKLYYEMDQQPYGADGAISFITTLYVVTKTP